jgi:hypothetical protein
MVKAVAYGLLDNDKSSKKNNRDDELTEKRVRFESILPLVVVNELDGAAYLGGTRRGKYVATYGS